MALCFSNVSRISVSIKSIEGPDCPAAVDAAIAS